MDKNKLKNLTVADLCTLLETSEQGINTGIAEKRLIQYGPNLIKNESRLSAGKLFIKQFKSSLVYLLLIACILAFLLKDFNDGLVIAVILVINTGLGFFQEFRSSKAVEKLQKLVSKEILVCRDGKQALVSEKLLVPGDLVILREGDIVPADIRLISVDDLSVNESQLTGESVPVVKKTAGSAAFAFAGSTVEQGEGKGYIYATAEHTELGKIAHLSVSTKRTTQFEKSLSNFSRFLVNVTFLTLLAVFLLKLILVKDSSQIGTLVLFIISLSIAVVPEAMPVIVSITLSRGALNLAKRHVITKTLTAVEDLGNIDVLCSDKTGTLTENKLTVKKLISDDPDMFKLLASASLETLDEKRRKFQSSFDQAFIKFVPGDIQQKAKQFTRLEELPFDPTARRRRVVYTDGHKTFLVEVGSVETLLMLTGDKKKDEYLKIIKDDGKVGWRHLAIAYKQVRYDNNQKFDILKHENELSFVGFVALEDPLRPSAKHTIALAEKLGVAIKILSGDSREVTEYVASEVGLINRDQRVFTGEEIDELNDEQLSELAAKNNAFAKLNPEQKYRIIKLLKLHGSIVGYQGDGINDAPALKLADVAIAVSNATDVAQDCADILLLRSDIGVIVNGIKYGREIFTNINKYIRYTLVGNFGNFFSLSVLYLLSSASLPMLPVQILLSNLLTDVPLITIATDNVATKELQRPSKFNVHSLMFISIFLGTITALFEIMYFALIKGHTTAVTQTGLYLFLTPAQLVIIFSVRNKTHFWHAPKLSSAMKLAFLLTTVISIVFIYLPYTQKLFSFTTLPADVLTATIVMTILYFVALDSIKTWFYKTNISNGI